MKEFSSIPKIELCAALGWSRPKLDRVLARHPDFPVRTRGTQRGGWQFDLPEVIAYLEQQWQRAPASAGTETAKARTDTGARQQSLFQPHEGEVL